MKNFVIVEALLKLFKLKVTRDKKQTLIVVEHG